MLLVVTSSLVDPVVLADPAALPGFPENPECNGDPLAAVA